MKLYLIIGCSVLAAAAIGVGLYFLIKHLKKKKIPEPEDSEEADAESDDEELSYDEANAIESTMVEESAWNNVSNVVTEYENPVIEIKEFKESPRLKEENEYKDYISNKQYVIDMYAYLDNRTDDMPLDVIDGMVEEIQLFTSLIEEYEEAHPEKVKEPFNPRPYIQNPSVEDLYNVDLLNALREDYEEAAAANESPSEDDYIYEEENDYDDDDDFDPRSLDPNWTFDEDDQMWVEDQGLRLDGHENEPWELYWPWLKWQMMKDANDPNANKAKVRYENMAGVYKPEQLSEEEIEQLLTPRNAGSNHDENPEMFWSDYDEWDHVTNDKAWTIVYGEYYLEDGKLINIDTNLPIEPYYETFGRKIISRFGKCNPGDWIYLLDRGMLTAYEIHVMDGDWYDPLASYRKRF